MSDSAGDSVRTLPEAVRGHVEAGDVVYVMTGHSRWTAGARELVRQFWGKDPGLTLVMLSLSSLGTLFFRGGLVRKVVTGYSGDIFPSFTPNPIFADAYTNGGVEVEHWSFLAFVQRLEAAARGLPAMVTRSITGSSMETNKDFGTVATPFGDIGLVAPLAPDVAFVHGVVSDPQGNIVLNPPLFEGAWGALAARKGVIATVEKIVEDIRPLADSVGIPAHRVLAVVEAPLGAHPGGLFARGMPVEGYGEDYEFWAEVRDASRREDFERWIEYWILEPSSQDDYLRRLGSPRVTYLREKAASGSWRRDASSHRPDLERAPNEWEIAATVAARYLVERILARRAHAVLAGAGVANLAAWLAASHAWDRGVDVQLTAELGLWGYRPRPGDPYIFNHRNFFTATMLCDASRVLGTFVGGANTTTIASLGAAQIDRYGNINSTLIANGSFLVGSGGGNDVASACAEALVVMKLRPTRTPEQLGYVTSPGRRVRAVATDLGLLEKDDDSGELVLTAVTAGDGTLKNRIARAIDACGWSLRVAEHVVELSRPTQEDIAALRSWDPKGVFLSAR